MSIFDIIFFIFRSKLHAIVLPGFVWDEIATNLHVKKHFKLEDLVQPALKQGQIYSILQKKHGRKVKKIINLVLGSLISYLSDRFITF